MNELNTECELIYYYIFLGHPSIERESEKGESSREMLRTPSYGFHHSNNFESTHVAHCPVSPDHVGIHLHGFHA